MKKFLLFSLALISISTFSQRRKKQDWTEYVRSSIDPHVKVMLPLGDNFLKDSFDYFYGFGIGGNLNLYKNFGLGAEYTYFLANDVRKPEVFGYLGAPSMSNFDWYLFHKDAISEDFAVEEILGYSTYRMKSPYLDNSGNFKEGNGGLNLGARIIYTLDNEGYQQVVFGTKINFYNSRIGNQNPEIEKYFSKAVFINFSLAYRYQF